MAIRRLWMLCLAALLVLKGHCGLEIAGCERGSVDIVEDTSPSFKCGTFWRGSLRWSTSDNYNDHGDTDDIGFCDTERCEYRYDKLNLGVERSSTNSYTSVLTILEIKRDTARRIICKHQGSEIQCILRIVAPAKIVSGNCIVTISNWWVQGSCQVENMYMLSDKYTCTWRENSAKIRGGFQDQRDFYWNLSRKYWKSVCSFSKLMPVDQNKFTYSIDIDPGSHDFFVKTINIIRPREPEHNCPDTVVVGSNVNCTCISLNMENPPANLVWDGKTDGILLLQDVQRENDHTSYTCRLTWGPNGFINKTIVYTLRVVENKQTSAANAKGGMIGGVVVAVVIVTFIGTLIAVYIVKRRKGTICKGKMRFWPCSRNFCHRKKPLSHSYAVVNRSQTPIIRHAAPSGDLYTVAMTTTSGEVHDDYVTLSQTIENTETDRICNFQANEDVTQTESRTNPTINCQQTTAGGRNFSDLSGTVYMNVTEVPTDSGLGVYHIVPWAVKPAQTQTDTGASYEEVISEEEYNVLQFEEDRTGQDHTAIYHHLEHE